MTTQEKAQSILKHGNCSHITCGLMEDDTSCPLQNIDCTSVSDTRFGRRSWRPALVARLEAVARSPRPADTRMDTTRKLEEVLYRAEQRGDLVQRYEQLEAMNDLQIKQTLTLLEENSGLKKRADATEAEARKQKDFWLEIVRQHEEERSVLKDVEQLFKNIKEYGAMAHKDDWDKVNFVWKRVKAVLYRPTQEEMGRKG